MYLYNRNYQNRFCFRYSKCIIKINISLTGAVEKVSIEINVHFPPKLSSCSITPRSGEALKTMFTVSCQYSLGKNTFEIYSTQNDIGILPFIYSNN